MRSLPQVHGTACRKHAEILIPSAASGASAPLAEKLAQARVNEVRARCLTCGHQAPLCPQDLGSSCLEDATSPVRSLLHAGHPKTCCDHLYWPRMASAWCQCQRFPRSMPLTCRHS